MQIYLCRKENYYHISYLHSVELTTRKINIGIRITKQYIYLKLCNDVISNIRNFYFKHLKTIQFI